MRSLDAKRRRGMTLVESLFAVGISALLLAFLGATTWQVFRTYRGQEGMLGEAHHAQVLLESLRRDVADLDAQVPENLAPPDPSGRLESPGGGFPKFWFHLVHSPGVDTLERFPVSASSKLWSLPPGHPMGDRLRPQEPSAALLRRSLLRFHNAWSWQGNPVAPLSGEARLDLWVRREEELIPVRYRFDPTLGQVTRQEGAEDPRVLVPAGVERFEAAPTLEILSHPLEPNRPPEALRSWLEVKLEFSNGVPGEPHSSPRRTSVQTRLLPYLLNSKIPSLES